jgi:hypothetical protein
VLAGCGGSSSSSTSSSSGQTGNFKASYESRANQFKHDSQSIGAAVQGASGQTDAQLATEFQGLATRWQTHLSQLETLKPPATLAATFNTLTNAASRAETDLTAIVSAAKTHSKSAAEQASANLVTDILSAKSASTTITQKLGTQ